MVDVSDRRIQVLQVQSQLEEKMSDLGQRFHLSLAEQIKILSDMVTERASALASEERARKRENSQ